MEHSTIKPSTVPTPTSTTATRMASRTEGRTLRVSRTATSSYRQQSTSCSRPESAASAMGGDKTPPVLQTAKKNSNQRGPSAPSLAEIRPGAYGRRPCACVRCVCNKAKKAVVAARRSRKAPWEAPAAALAAAVVGAGRRVWRHGKERRAADLDARARPGMSCVVRVRVRMWQPALLCHLPSSRPAQRRGLDETSQISRYEYKQPPQSQLVMVEVTARGGSARVSGVGVPLYTSTSVHARAWTASGLDNTLDAL